MQDPVPINKQTYVMLFGPNSNPMRQTRQIFRPLETPAETQNDILGLLF